MTSRGELAPTARLGVIITDRVGSVGCRGMVYVVGIVGPDGNVFS